MLKSFFDYWKGEWQNNRVLFWFEIIGTLSSMVGALLLNLLAPNPPFFLTFSLYLIGSVLLALSSYIRKAGWLCFLMLFYSVLNIVGLVNLVV